MKLVNIFGLLIVPIFAVWFAVAIQKKPEVRYLVSEQVPYLDGESKGTRDTVQKLEVRNIGDAEAKRVVVKIDGQVVGWNLKKFLESDNFHGTEVEGGAEFIYDSLPPSGAFHVSWKARAGAGPSRITVIHESGTGKEALSDKNTISPWLSLLAIFMSIAYMYASFRELKSKRRHEFNSWETRQLPPSQLWAKTRPWLLSDAEWEQLRIEIAKINIATRGMNIAESFAYKLLESPDSIPLPREVRQELLDKAIDVVVKAFAEGINSAWDELSIEKVMRAAKPEGLPADIYEEIRGNALRAWRSRAVRYKSPEEVLTYLASRARPAFILETEYEQFVESLRAEMVRGLKVLIVDSRSPENVVPDSKAALLSKSNLMEIQAAKDRRRKDISRVDSADELCNAVQHILEGQEVPKDSLELQPKSVCHMLERLSEQIAEVRLIEQSRKTLEGLKLEQEQENTRLATARARVDEQLSLIHSALSDPSSLNRIESHRNVFAPGNFENLVLIAKLHQEKRRI